MSEDSPATPASRGSRALRFTGQALLVLALLGAALGTWHIVSPRSSPLNLLLTQDSLPAIPRDRRPLTLDPALFRGEAAEAYRVAKERPALLERVPCYCGCYLKQGHQNSLDCFADRHAEACTLCVRIALRAEQLEKAGYAPADIKALIDREFATLGR